MTPSNSETTRNLLVTGASTVTTVELINKLSRESPRKFNTHTVSTSQPMDEIESIFAATRFDAVYLVLRQKDQSVDDVKSFLDVVKHRRVPFVIFLSVIGLQDLPVDLAERYVQVEAHLKAIRIPHAILRVAPLQQDFCLLSPDFHQQPIATIELPFSNGAVAPIHAKDVANVAATLLNDSALHVGKTYVLTGPDLLTGVEIAGRAAIGLGRPVGFRNVLPSEARDHLLSLAEPKLERDAVEDALRMFEQVASHGCECLTTTVQQLTARPATHIEDFFRENRKLFNAQPERATAAATTTPRRRGLSGADSVRAAYVGLNGNGLGRYLIRSKL